MSHEIKVTRDLVTITEIQRLIPHRYPFFLLDRLEKVEAPVRCIGTKNVTINEPFFQGHFPDHPVMPGVLIIESMAQAATCLVSLAVDEDAEENVVYFTTLDSTRFRKPVIPGDTLKLHIELVKYRLGMWRFEGKAYVDDELVANSLFSAQIMKKDKKA